jgi:Ca2+-binding RTX toxin-like protein
VAFGPTTARAVSCSINGTAYTCEASCTGTGACNVETGLGHSACDSVLGGGNGDGWCTICGDGSNNNITGTNGADIICGKGGNDTIYGRVGNDLILGGDGNDTLRGGDGDDEVDGQDGDDLVYGDRSNDVVRGGKGDDYVEGNAAPFINSELGDILCGGEGDDLLVAVGNGHYCFDPGPDQAAVAWGTGYDCSYVAPIFTDDGDVATQRNCVQVDTSSSAFNASQRSCNCQD